MKRNLDNAKMAKMDEFYTQYGDIEKELVHYGGCFKDKVVLCNCDDPRTSNFFRYFSLNFHRLGLRKLIASCYKNQEFDLFMLEKERATWIEYGGELKDGCVPEPDEIGIHCFEGDGDFRGLECIELLKQADIVCTNPPFSLFREFVAQMIKYEKGFLIVGSQNAITYKEMFSLIKENRLWLGCTGGSMEFKVPSDYPEMETRYWVDETGQKWRSMGNTYWFTNLVHDRRNEDLPLAAEFDKSKYPRYDNCDAIDVGEVGLIPKDYYGLMGVPITFLHKYNPKQFEIVRFRKGDDGRDLSIGGKCPYFRILIKKKC